MDCNLDKMSLYDATRALITCHERHNCLMIEVTIIYRVNSYVTVTMESLNTVYTKRSNLFYSPTNNNSSKANSINE